MFKTTENYTYQAKYVKNSKFANMDYFHLIEENMENESNLKSQLTLS